jgi:hypothetical protein
MAIMSNDENTLFVGSNPLSRTIFPPLEKHNGDLKTAQTSAQ